VKLTTHLHQVPRSIMRGVIPPLPQYAFIVWCLVKKKSTGTNYLYLYAFGGRLGSPTAVENKKILC